MAKLAERKCSFCDRAESDVQILFTGLKGNICDACIENAHTLLQDAVTAERAELDGKNDLSKHRLYKPREIKAFLDQYVIGQETRRKCLV